MSDQNDDNNPNAGGGKPNDDNNGHNGGSNPDFKAQVDAAVQEALKPIKAKLDQAYGARDSALDELKEAKKTIAQFEQKEREAEITRLKEEGKHKEAFEAELRDRDARIAALEESNTRLSRDQQVREALSGVEFRNKKAHELAVKEITAQLVRNEAGEWVHKSGSAVTEFATQFLGEEDNAFLLKAKQSSGGGTGSVKPSSTQKKNILDMSQEEVMKGIQDGSIKPPF